MQEKQRNKVIKHMDELAKMIDGKLQRIEEITYYDEFEFKGSGLATKNVYIVEIATQKQLETADKSERNTTYEIYDKNSGKIADIDINGKIHFVPEFIEKLRQIDKDYLEQLNLDDLDFELPEELDSQDIKLSKKELLKERTKEKTNKDNEEKDEEQEKEEKDLENETEEEKKQKTAEALNIDEEEIKSISTIDPNQKITDKYTLRDIIPEIASSKMLTVAYTKEGNFTILNVKADGTREKIDSLDSIEGVATNKNVISINEDGSKVEEKQVKGLMRINARNREDGLAISIGDYGMMNIDYVSNVMDKEHRRATPIRTKESENQRIANERVRENAGDSKEEMEREGKKFRANEEKGINPQTLDGIETENIDGNVTLDELKKQIKEDVLDKGDMSRRETQEYIEGRIQEAGLSLSEAEINNTVNEIETQVLDESRFPTRNERK